MEQLKGEEKETPPKVPLTLRLPRGLYEELKEEADRLGLDLKSLIVLILLAYISSHSLQWLRRFPVRLDGDFSPQQL